MARLFGEFLVRKNLVTTSQVLEALMIQIRNLPTYAEICYENELIPDEQLFRVLADQQRSGKDFRCAAEHAGIWSESIGASIERVIRAQHKPVGEILIDLGYLTLETLTCALDEYVSALSADRSANIPGDVGLSFDPERVQQFLSNYESVVKPALEQISRTIDASEDTHGAILRVTRHFVAEVSGIKGAAEFLGALTLAQLAGAVVSTMKIALDKSNYAHHAELSTIVKATFHIFEACVQSISEFGTDDVFSFDVNMADLRKRLYKELAGLAGKLGFEAGAA